MITETTGFDPTYPTIPHIVHARFIFLVNGSRIKRSVDMFERTLVRALPTNICVTIAACAKKSRQNYR
jgi:hypothetical protein